MNSDFEYFSKLIASAGHREHYLKENNTHDIKEFKETQLFDSENGVFNNELLTREGFINGLFETANIDEREKLTKEDLGRLFDSIAGMDGDEQMSQKELEFFASLGNDENKKGMIDKSDLRSFTYDAEITKQMKALKDEIGLNRPVDFLESDPEYIAWKESNENILSDISPNAYREYLKTVPRDNNNGSDNSTTSEKPEDTELKYKKGEEIKGNDRVSEKNITAVNDRINVDGSITGPIIQSKNNDDCWIIAGLNSLNATETGKKIIRNSIIPNEDGTVTVNFAGLDKSITVTPDEIKKYDTDLNVHDLFSNGDNDVLVMELAVAKLIKEDNRAMDGKFDGGQMENLWRALTPNHTIETFNKHGGIPQENIFEVLQNALNNKNLALGFGIQGSIDLQLSNGERFECNTSGHVLAIVEVKENEVIFNDSISGKSYTATWEEFAKLKPAGLFSIDLTNA